MDPSAQGETNIPTQRLNNRGRHRQQERERLESKKQRSRITTPRYYYFISLFTSNHNNLLFFPLFLVLSCMYQKPKIKPFISFSGLEKLICTFYFLMTGKGLCLTSKCSRLQQFGSLLVLTDNFIPVQSQLLSICSMFRFDFKITVELLAGLL